MKTISQIIKQAAFEQWDTEEVFAVYDASTGSNMGVVKVGTYDACVAKLKSVPCKEKYLCMVELAEGYQLRSNAI